MHMERGVKRHVQLLGTLPPVSGAALYHHGDTCAKDMQLSTHTYINTLK